MKTKKIYSILIMLICIGFNAIAQQSAYIQKEVV